MSEIWKKISWFFNHDNVPAQSSLFIRDICERNPMAVLPQPSYFPDLATTDFSLFSKLKFPLERLRFTTMGNIK